jgi:hypothetical protein
MFYPNNIPGFAQRKISGCLVWMHQFFFFSNFLFPWDTFSWHLSSTYSHHVNLGTWNPVGCPNRCPVGKQILIFFFLISTMDLVGDESVLLQTHCSIIRYQTLRILILWFSHCLHYIIFAYTINGEHLQMERGGEQSKLHQEARVDFLLFKKINKSIPHDS